MLNNLMSENFLDSITKFLKTLSNQGLLSKTKNLVAQEREITAQILHCLAEIQSRRLYSELGYGSLFMFCVKYLGFTESQAQRRIEAMRTIIAMPEVENKIKAGALSLTALAQAQSFFRQNEVPLEKRAEVLSKLENKSTRECEKALVLLSPQKELPKDKTRPLNETHTQVTLCIPNELVEKLEKLKGLLSHVAPRMSQGELLDKMAEICLDKLDPQRRAAKLRERERERAKGREKEREKQMQKEKEKDNKMTSAEACKGSEVRHGASTAPKVTRAEQITLPSHRAQGSKRRKYISVNTEGLVWEKEGGRCSYVSRDGIRCESRFQLEIEHRIPLSLGGSDNLENLSLLCGAHNKFMALKVLGPKVMGKYLNKDV